MENRDMNSSRNYNATIDIAKLLFVLLVVGIHTEPFGFSFLLDNGFGIITRMCVPFFFVTSSYLFFNKDKEPFKYVRRIFVLYLVWCVIYLSMNFAHIRRLSFFKLIQHYLWDGHDVLWYLMASVIGFLITYALSRLVKPKAVLFIGIAFLLMGCIKSTYSPLVYKITFINIPDFWGSRNGLFYAFPYYALGLYVAKKESNSNSKIVGNIVRFVIMLCVLAIESALLVLKFKVTATILWISVFPLTYYLLIILKETNIPLSYRSSLVVRKISTLVYVIHPFFLRLFDELEYFGYFFVVSLASVLVAVLIVYFSNKKHLRWLRILS